MNNTALRWVKGGDKLSQHYIKVCCRVMNSDYYFTAYYDWSLKVYVIGNGQSYKPEEIEWLDEQPLQEQGYIPLENIFKSPLSTEASREFWKRFFTENNFEVYKKVKP